MGDILDAVFINLHLVGHGGQRAELGAELVLGLRDLVVMLLDRQAHLAHGGEHLGAQIALAIHGRHGEVPALHAGAVAHIAFRIVLHVGARPLDRIELIGAEIAARAEFHAVEDEEFRLGADKGGIADTGGFQIILGLLGGGAGVSRIALAGGGFDDVAEQDEARLGREGVQHRRLQIRLEDHVGFVDRLPAGDGGAVEHEAMLQRVLIHGADILRGMLPFAPGVGESQIHVLNPVFLDEVENPRDAVAALGLLSHVYPRCVRLRF